VLFSLFPFYNCLNTLPGVSVRQLLFSSCSVWAWRKPGINSWLRAEPTCRTAFKKRPPKSLKNPRKGKKGLGFVWKHVQNPRTPDSEKDPHYIYIYKEGTKRGGVKTLISGFKKGGVFKPLKGSKTPKIPPNQSFG